MSRSPAAGSSPAFASSARTSRSSRSSRAAARRARPDRLPAEALGFGTKAIWPDDRGVQPRQHARRLPVDATRRARRPGRPTRTRLDATQERRRRPAASFWQRSSWTRARRRHQRPTRRAGRWPTTSPTRARVRGASTSSRRRDAAAVRRLEDERYAYFAEASIVYLDLPDAVFRGYGATTSSLVGPRRRPGAVDLLGARSCGWSRRRSTCRSAVGGHVDHQLCARSGIALLDEGRALGDARARLRRPDRASTRTSRTPGGMTSTGPPTCRATAAGLPPGLGLTASTPTSATSRAQGGRPPALRQPGGRTCSTATRPCWTTSPATTPRVALEGGSPATPNATGRPHDPDPAAWPAWATPARLRAVRAGLTVAGLIFTGLYLLILVGGQGSWMPTPTGRPTSGTCTRAPSSAAATRTSTRRRSRS